MAEAAAIRNVVQLNPAPDGLAFAAAGIGRSARRIWITELGPAVRTVAVLLPPALRLQALLPRPVAFGHAGTALDRLLDQHRPARLLVVHRLGDPALLARLLADADALCLAPPDDAPWVAQAIGRAGLVSCDPSVDLRAYGLANVGCHARPAGRSALVTALWTLEASWQARRRRPHHVYDIDDLPLHAGFYPIERDAIWRWAWTGPDTVASVLVPLHGAEHQVITLFFFAAKQPVDADHVTVLLNGTAPPARHYTTDMKIEVEVRGLAEAAFARLDLVQRATVPTDDHSRRLGYALHKLRIDAVGATAA